MFEYSFGYVKNDDSLLFISEKVNEYLMNDDDFNEMLSLYDDPFWHVYAESRHHSIIIEIHAEMAFLDKQWIKDHFEKVVEREMVYEV